MTAPTSWESVVARLDALEARNHALARQNRWLRRLGLAAAVVAGLALLGTAGSGQADDPKAKKVVEADEFVVKGADGKRRTTVGAGIVTLHNEDGDARLVLYANKPGGSGVLIFAANDQKQQMSVMHTKEGLMSFAINDKTGKTRFMAATRPDGKPVLVLQNEQGKSFFAQAQP